MTTNEQGIGARLRAERRRLKMTQEDFATACGVARRAQTAYEAGTRYPDARYLALAASLGVDIAFVVTGTTSRNGGVNQ